MMSGMPIELGRLLMRNVYRFEAWRRGELLWVREIPNLVTNEGLNEVLQQFYKGSAYTASFFVGLVDVSGFTAFAATDVAAQIGGTNAWSETGAYSQTTRPSLVLGSVATQSVDNTASPATFTMNATKTLKGAFLSTSSVKSGTGGKLIGEAAFTGGNEGPLNSGDTLKVSAVLTAASA